MHAVAERSRRWRRAVAAVASVAALAVPVVAQAGGTSAAVHASCVRVAPATWSVTRLAAETIVVPVDEGDVAAVSSEVATGVGGVILFGDDAPVSLGRQLSVLVGGALAHVAPFVMVDEEGGEVQRLPALVGNLPSARVMGATMTPAAIGAAAFAVGRRLRALGVTMDLAPVLDLDGASGPNSRDADGTRSFSLDAAVAARDGIAFARGLARAGVVPVIKHFPGLGGATGNTDDEPAATPPLATLEKAGLLPFEGAIAAGLPAAMVANASVPGLTTGPASVSSAVVTGLLKKTLGFKGLVITDSLSVPSVTDAGYTVASASVAALRAGADLTLFNASASAVASTASAVEGAIVTAVGNGTLSRARLLDAVRHDLSARGALGTCPAS